MLKPNAGAAPHDDDNDARQPLEDGRPVVGTPSSDGVVAPQETPVVEPAVSLNPFADLASLNLGANYTTDGIKVKRKLLTMPMGSPDKKQFFRAIREETDFIARVYERPVPGDLKPTVYFVAPALHGDASLARVLKMVKLVRCVYHDTHLPFLWPISIGQRDNAWSRTALDIAAAAADGYVRCVPDGRNGYAIELPENLLGEPTWPELTRAEWFDLAFKGRVIDSFEHEAIRELRGAL
jgi:hypothetical protein